MNKYFINNHTLLIFEQNQITLESWIAKSKVFIRCQAIRIK